MELAFQWNTGYQVDGMHSFANGIATIDGGTHEEGFRAALTTVVNKYARSKGALKEKDQNFAGEDIREGLSAIISVRLREPQFEGQTKAKLGNADLKGAVQAAVSEGLSQYLDENPGDGRKIIEKSQTAQRAREAARKARDLVIRKSALEGSALVVTTGIVLQELLQGFAGPRAREDIVDRFSALPLLVPDRHDHIEAASLRNACRRAGVQLGRSQRGLEHEDA